MREIQRLVRSLGIGATYRGFQYLSYAIKLCLQNEDYLLSVSKLLYPQIAKYYHTTTSSVERNIRTVVSVCWSKGNRQLLEDIAPYPLADKPTCSEFLDILSAHLNKNEYSIPVFQ